MGFRAFIKVMKAKQNSSSNHDSVYELRERVKELSCLYRITDLANRPGLEISDILQQAVDIIPEAMQYPDTACSGIRILNKHYVSVNFADSHKSLSADILPQYGEKGILEVFYPDGKNNEFLAEEQRLIEAIAKQLALVIDRRHIQCYSDKLQDQLRHADRLATIGQLSAGIAHEINEPLAVILGFSELVLSETKLPKASRDDLQKVISAAMHAREIVRKLMLFSRQVPPSMEIVDINKLIKDGFYFLENRCAHQEVQIVRHLEPNLPAVFADRSQIHQVIVNLCVNALQAMPQGGLITISTRKVNESVELKIADTGTGMDSETLKKIFLPFFTTKDVDEGTGLGLSVVHGIISAHNGAIKVDSTPGKGSVFKVYLNTAHFEDGNKDIK